MAAGNCIQCVAATTDLITTSPALRTGHYLDGVGDCRAGVGEVRLPRIEVEEQLPVIGREPR